MATIKSECQPKRVYDPRIMPGVVRTIETFERTAQPLSEIEQRRQAIAERERAEAEANYRRLVFEHAKRDLTDAEVVELAGLADKLGLPASAPDEHREAIRTAARIQKVVDEPDADFAALEKAATETDAAARQAIRATIVDLFAGFSIGELIDARREIWSLPRFQRQAYADPNRPDHHDRERTAAAHDANSTLAGARNRKPRAESELHYLKKANPILWPD